MQGQEHTLEGEETNKGGARGVVDAPPLEEACGQVETLPSCQDGLCGNMNEIYEMARMTRRTQSMLTAYSTCHSTSPSGGLST